MEREVGILIDYIESYKDEDEEKRSSIIIEKRNCGENFWNDLKEMCKTKMSYELEEIVKEEIHGEGTLPIFYENIQIAVLETNVIGY